STRIPAIIGSHSTLSTYVALYARSGGGKSTAVAVAGELLPDVPPSCRGPLSLGSGEGLIDAYFELVEDTDGGGKKKMVKRQIYRGVLFTLDEGQVLNDLGGRRGSTILPILRSAWSGSDTGQANASLETRRILAQNTYAIGMVSLWQAEAAAKLIEDSDGGTPQRIVWFDATSSEIDADADIDWPGPITWTPPAAIVMAGTYQPHPLDIHPDIRHEVRHHHAAVGNGTRIVDPLDTHRNLAKLKVAGILAVLDGRHNIDLEDWELAERVMEHSDGVRKWVVAEAARKRQATEEQSIRKHIGREAAVEESAVQRSLTRAAKACHRAASRCAPAPLTRRDATLAVTGRDRKLVTVDEALAEAERLRWLVPHAPEGWVIGDAAPR
ncbi:MAG: hypothetical protein RL134_2704, partial [Actinomycetota bacterium]